MAKNNDKQRRLHKSHNTSTNTRSTEQWLPKRRTTSPKEIKHIMKLLHEVPDHVGFTVSLTDFTCLDGSVFAKNCLTASQNIDEEKISNKLIF